MGYTDRTPGRNTRKADAGPLKGFKGKALAKATVRPKGGGTGVSKTLAGAKKGK
jgi:hypothetical protein